MALPGARRRGLLTLAVPRGKARLSIDRMTAMKRNTKRPGKTPTPASVLAPSESFALDVEAPDEHRAHEAGDDEFFHDDEAEETAPADEAAPPAAEGETED